MELRYAKTSTSWFSSYRTVASRVWRLGAVSPTLGRSLRGESTCRSKPSFGCEHRRKRVMAMWGLNESAHSLDSRSSWDCRCLGTPLGRHRSWVDCCLRRIPARRHRSWRGTDQDSADPRARRLLVWTRVRRCDVTCRATYRAPRALVGARRVVGASCGSGNPTADGHGR